MGRRGGDISLATAVGSEEEGRRRGPRSVGGRGKGLGNLFCRGRFVKGGEAAGEGEKGERSPPPPPPDRGCHHCQAPSLFWREGKEAGGRKEEGGSFVRSSFRLSLSLSNNAKGSFIISRAAGCALLSLPSPDRRRWKWLGRREAQCLAMLFSRPPPSSPSR